MPDAPRPTLLAVPVAPERDHLRGPPDAPVMLLEYGDYECPYCGRAYPIVRQLRGDLGDRLCFAFRNFPLNNVHPHASAAAQAAEAAAAQGKFWEMHDLLYEHQGDLEPHDLDRYALRVGLEIYKFQSDVSGQRYAKRVRDDFESGERSGVRGTPTFFVNGVRYGGKLTYEELLGAINAVGTAAPGSAAES